MAIGSCAHCGAPIKPGESCCIYCGCSLSSDDISGRNATQCSFIIRAGVLKAFIGEETNITIPKSVLMIGESVFANCRYLSSVNIPDSVQEIGKNAFYRCTSLKSVIIPKNVEYIGERAFEECESLQSVNIIDGVKEIGRRAFYNCTSLKSVSIPESVEYIGDMAFLHCPELQEIKTPERWRELFEPSPRMLLAQQWKAEGRCEYCGGQLRGHYFRRCIRCGCRP